MSGYTKPATNNTIYLMRLDNATGLPSSTDTTKYALEPGHIEASYIYYHSGYYYLFWNSGGCCSGAASTYEIHMARSLSITGPYGASSIFIASNGTMHGPGQIGIYDKCGADRFTYHYYPATGGSVLGENELSWGSDGWPVVGPPSTTPLTPCGGGSAGDAGGSSGATGSATSDAGAGAHGSGEDATAAGPVDGGVTATGDSRARGETGGQGGSGVATGASGATASTGTMVAGGSGGSAGTSGAGAAGASAGTPTPPVGDSAAGSNPPGGCDIRGVRSRDRNAALFLLTGLVLAVATRRFRSDLLSFSEPISPG